MRRVRGYALVIKTEEKGSDVNLATHLLLDAFQGRYDLAVVITNDTDLLAPILAVRKELRKKVGLLSPAERPSRELRNAVDFVKPIRSGVLAAAQFPDEVRNGSGVIRRPATW
jgi:uncharacterized LabA/DUF88 family protein